jgi:hypothetical protein
MPEMYEIENARVAEEITKSGLTVAEREQLLRKLPEQLAVPASAGWFTKLSTDPGDGTVLGKITTLETGKELLLKGGDEEHPYLKNLSLDKRSSLIHNLDSTITQIRKAEMTRVEKAVEDELEVLLKASASGLPYSDVKTQVEALAAQYKAIGGDKFDLIRKFEFMQKFGEGFYNFAGQLANMNETQAQVAISREDPMNNPEQYGVYLPEAISLFNILTSNVKSRFSLMTTNPVEYAASTGRSVDSVFNQLNTPFNERTNFSKAEMAQASVHLGELWNGDTGQGDIASALQFFNQQEKPVSFKDQQEMLKAAGWSDEERTNFTIVNALSNLNTRQAFLKALRSPSKLLTQNLPEETNKQIHEGLIKEAQSIASALNSSFGAGALPYANQMMKVFKNEVYRNLQGMGDTKPDTVAKAIAQAKKTLGIEANRVGAGQVLVLKEEAAFMQQSLSHIDNNSQNYVLQGNTARLNEIPKFTFRRGAPTLQSDLNRSFNYFANLVGVPTASLRALASV